MHAPRTWTKARFASLTAVALACVACGGNMGRSVAAPSPEESSAPTSTTAPAPASTSASPPAEVVPRGTDVIVTCYDDGQLNHITVYDSTSGTVLLRSDAQLQLSGEYTTPSGPVTFTPHDAGSLGCGFQSFGDDYSSVPGVASFDDGREVPAFVDVDGTSLTLAAPVPPPPSGFSAGEPVDVVDALYTGDGQLWWVELPPDTDTYVVRSADGDAETFELADDGSFVDVSSFGVYRDGGWFVSLDYQSFYKYRLSDGTLLDSYDFLPAWFNPYVSDADAQILPDTQYTIGEGRYKLDGSSVAFPAQPPGETVNKVFVVPSSGGEPTPVVEGVPDEQVIFYGPYPG